MKLLVALAVMGPSKPFPAAGPLALEWLLFVVRAHVPFQVEMSCEGTATSGDGTSKVCIRLPSPLTSLRRSSGSDIGFADRGEGSRRVDPVDRRTTQGGIGVKLLTKLPDTARRYAI